MVYVLHNFDMLSQNGTPMKALLLGSAGLLTPIQGIEVAFPQELGLKGRSGTVKNGQICQRSDHHMQKKICDVLDQGSVSFQKGPAFQTSIADALL